MSLKHLPLSERPRERLARYGHEGLSTIELLAILLGSGTKERSVLNLAMDLFSHFGNLRAIGEATIRELCKVKGIGKAKAIQLKAALALFSRIEAKEETPILDTPYKIYALLKERLTNCKVETLFVVLCDVRRRFLHLELVARGTLHELLFHPREIFHLAIRHQAHSVVIAHNHPSGDLSPSLQDIKMTNVLKEAARWVGIELSDHLIVSASGFFSFKEKGIFDAPHRDASKTQ